MGISKLDRLGSSPRNVGWVAGSVAEGTSMAICTNDVVIQHPRIVRDAARGEQVIAMQTQGAVVVGGDRVWGGDEA
jgi:hypothetical protein